jgi:hypothetical protein
LEVDEDTSNGVVNVFPKFSPDIFFYILLPPIILESSYSLYDKAFFDNLSTILVMAVIGTAFNFLAIGLLLYLVFDLGAMGQIKGPFPPDDHPEQVCSLFVAAFCRTINYISVSSSSTATTI